MKKCQICLRPSSFRRVDYLKSPAIPDEKLGVFRDAHVEICDLCNTGLVSDNVSSADLADFYKNLYLGHDASSRSIRDRLSNPISIYSRSANQFISFFRSIDIQNKRVAEVGPNVVGWSKICKILQAQSYAYFDALRSKEIEKSGGEYLGFLDFKSLSAIESESYDMLILSHSLEHMLPKNVVEYVAQFRRILAPEGILFVEIPLELSFHDLRLIPPHTLYFTEEGLRSFLESNGFEICDYAISKRRHVGEVARTATSPVFSRLLKLASRYLFAMFPRQFALHAIFEAAKGYPQPKFDYIRLIVKKATSV